MFRLDVFYSYSGSLLSPELDNKCDRIFNKVLKHLLPLYYNNKHCFETKTHLFVKYIILSMFFDINRDDTIEELHSLLK